MVVSISLLILIILNFHLQVHKIIKLILQQNLLFIIKILNQQFLLMLLFYSHHNLFLKYKHFKYVTLLTFRLSYFQIILLLYYQFFTYLILKMYFQLNLNKLSFLKGNIKIINFLFILLWLSKVLVIYILNFYTLMLVFCFSLFLNFQFNV